jgi:hypothetical protein
MPVPAPLLSTQTLGRRRHKRVRAATVAVLVGLFALFPSSALALHGHGIVQGPWSCSPDERISMVFHVTGTGTGYKAGAAIHYRDTLGDDYIFDRNMYAGWTTMTPPRASRTIYFFEWSTYGDGVIASWTKSCS